MLKKIIPLCLLVAISLAACAPAGNDAAEQQRPTRSATSARVPDGPTSGSPADVR